MLEQALQTFRPHHLELRKRIIRILLTIVLCSCVAYLFSEQIAGFFMQPLYKASPLVKKLVYTNLPEAFVAYIKLAILVGIVVSMPIILFQIWSFMAPGLKKKEKRTFIAVIFWSSFLFALGAFFAFFGVLPRMLSFFMSYANSHLIPLPRFGLYLTFIARTMLSFGIAFEIPFLMVMTGKAGLVHSHYFSRRRLYFYCAIAVLSFLLSGGELMSTALLTIPLVLLYEIGILLMTLFPPAKQSLSAQEEE